MKDYKTKQHAGLEKLKFKLIKGYRYNSFGNRRTRRQTAKRSGYFQRDKDGNTAWPSLKAAPDSNVQTIRLTADSKT